MIPAHKIKKYLLRLLVVVGMLVLGVVIYGTLFGPLAW